MASELERRVLITGGAGFIGSNLAAFLLQNTNARVRILDNLSRRGVELNVQWLRNLARDSDRLQLIAGDVRNADTVTAACDGVSEIYHLAAQVAVTTSVDDPRGDFAVNAMGTLNVLEAARALPRKPMLLFTSTNKVYGALDTLTVQTGPRRCFVADAGFRGVSEETPLDFHSPYGCSKGAADQYVRDYARIYGLPTVVFRMSCICGPRQFGTEDQGWVAHFLYSVLSGRQINIYGDGKQVRDVLHVDDLIAAMQAAREHLPATRGEVYNVGGGMERAVSVLEILSRIEQQTGKSCSCSHGEMRPGDQPLYITDFSKLTRDTQWQPRRSVEQTLADITKFWNVNRDLIGRPRMPALITEVPGSGVLVSGAKEQVA
ncbi:MAG: GDP-mannose 4,6-dehydratase [Acidobacteriaceae bacterium]